MPGLDGVDADRFKPLNQGKGLRPGEAEPDPVAAVAKRGVDERDHRLAVLPSVIRRCAG